MSDARETRDKDEPEYRRRIREIIDEDREILDALD